MIPLTYPIICISKRGTRIRHDESGFLTTSTAGLRNGFFDDLLVIDSAGVGLRVKTAKKKHSVGWFWGFNIFLNQRIRVDLVLEGEPFSVSVVELRQILGDHLKRGGAWRSRGDFHELRAKLKQAGSIREVIELIGP